MKERRIQIAVTTLSVVISSLAAVNLAAAPAANSALVPFHQPFGK